MQSKRHFFIFTVIVWTLLFSAATGCRFQDKLVDQLNTAIVNAKKPRVLSISPTDESVEISVQTSIQMTFNKSVELESAQEAFLLTNEQGEMISCTMSFATDEGNKILIRPEFPLEYNTHYTVTLYKSVQSTDGYPLLEEFSSHFFTQVSPPLTFQSIIPLTPNLIQVKFQQDLVWESATNLSSYLILNENGNPLTITGVSQAVDKDPRTILLSTYSHISNSTYNLKIFGLEGVNGEGTPDEGISIDYSSFNGQLHLQIVTDSTVFDKKAFKATVTVINTETSTIIQAYKEDIQWSVLGNGSIQTIEPQGWIAGTQEFMITYDGNLGLHETENIVLQAKTLDGNNYQGASDTINVFAPIAMDYFKVEAEASAFANSDFSVTITAMGNNEQIFTDYDGTVSLQPNVLEGNLSVTEVTGFVNGIATVSLSCDTPQSALQVIVTDTTDSDWTGISNVIRIYYDLLAFTGIPVSNDRIRLQWTVVNDAVEQKLFRKVGPNWILVSTLISPESVYTEIGLTGGETYQYKLEVYNGLGELLQWSETTIELEPCTEVPNYTITSDETWSVVNSPYCVNSDVHVSNAVLTIEPGVVLMFADDTGLYIDTGATLLSEGQPNDLIVFSSANANALPGDWDGITFADDAVGTDFVSDQYVGGSLVTYSIFEYGDSALETRVSMLVENCLFHYNYSSLYGGAIKSNLFDNEQIIISNSSFIYNQAQEKGGGISLEDGSGTSKSIIQTCTFYKNSVGDTGGANWGGGLYITTEINIIQGCIFRENYTDDSGAALFIWTTDNVLISTCLFEDNEGSVTVQMQGGSFSQNECNRNLHKVIYSSNGGPSISNNIFSENLS